MSVYVDLIFLWQFHVPFSSHAVLSFNQVPIIVHSDCFQFFTLINSVAIYLDIFIFVISEIKSSLFQKSQQF